MRNKEGIIKTVFENSKKNRNLVLGILNIFSLRNWKSKYRKHSGKENLEKVGQKSRVIIITP